LTTKVLKSNVSYGLQPNAYMSNGKKLQTNDARVLTALYQKNALYFGSNTIDTGTFSPSIYVGHIDYLDRVLILTSYGKNYFVRYYQIMDIQDVAYAGGGTGDKSAIIYFSHTSDKTFPGTSVAVLIEV
jgi:hypothetical protein